MGWPRCGTRLWLIHTAVTVTCRPSIQKARAGPSFGRKRLAPPQIAHLRACERGRLEQGSPRFERFSDYLPLCCRGEGASALRNANHRKYGRERGKSQKLHEGPPVIEEVCARRTQVRGALRTDRCELEHRGGQD